MALTVKEYQDLLKKHKTIAGVARATGRNERSLRRWVNKHVVNEDGPAVMTTGADSAVTDINAVVLKALNKNTVSREELAEKLNITPRILSAVIEDIEEQGHVLEEIDGVVRVSKRVALRGENRHDETWSGEEIIRFGVVADTHLCNKYQQLTHLNAVYDIFAQEGISTVYHVGDIVDGYYRNRPGHVYELFRIGADEQADYVTEFYPRREGVVTKFITGNHDHTHIINGGTNIGVKIANSRDDMVYLGMSNAKVNVTPKCILEINHPEDGACFDDETEILTQEGWKLFSDLMPDDYVATMTKEGHEFQWQKPEMITKQKYEGVMYHIKARLLNMMVTPNHGLWVRINPINHKPNPNVYMPQKAHSKLSLDWHMETAHQVANNYYRQKWQMTNQCLKWNGVVAQNYIDVPYLESKNKGMHERMKHIGRVDLMDMCELMAWYVTEGTSDEKKIVICQSKEVNPDNHKMITDLFERMNLPYNVYGREDKDIVVGSVELATYLRDTCGIGSRNKHLPRFIKELPTKYLQRIFDIMILGDGWNNGKALGYKSISKQLRTDIMEIAIKLGYGVHENKDTVHINSLQVNPTINKKPEEVDYSGFVYCCKVPNELILVRRHGTATWSHNSYALSYSLQKTIDAMMGGEKPNIFLNGHHHKLFYMIYRNIHAYECGTFEEQTPFMRGKKLAAHVGGLIIEAHVDEDGTVIRCKNEFIPFYKMIKDDY